MEDAGKKKLGVCKGKGSFLLVLEEQCKAHKLSLLRFFFPSVPLPIVLLLLGIGWVSALAYDLFAAPVWHASNLTLMAYPFVKIYCFWTLRDFTPVWMHVIVASFGISWAEQLLDSVGN